MKNVVIEELMAETGLGKNSARRLVRKGNLPGFIDGSAYVCSRGEFEKWKRGEWQFTGVRSTPPAGRKKPEMIHEIKRERAA